MSDRECCMFGCHRPLFALHHDPEAGVVYALCEDHATKVAERLDAQDRRVDRRPRVTQSHHPTNPAGATP